MTRITKEFSHKYVQSQSINFAKFHTLIDYHNKRAVQIFFFVIIIKSIQDFHKFSEMTSQVEMSLHKWLIIFTKTSNSYDTIDNDDLNNLCENPRNNYFNLVATTKMLIKCHENPIVREWYSFDNVKIETQNLISWTRETGIVKLTLKHLRERRSDFNGHPLKISTVKVS